MRVSIEERKEGSHHGVQSTIRGRHLDMRMHQGIVRQWFHGMEKKKAEEKEKEEDYFGQATCVFL